MATTEKQLKLLVLSPEKTLLDNELVLSVIANGEEGSFGILPNHQPLLAPLKAGILEYRVLSGEKRSVLLPTKAILSTDGQEVVVLCQ
jgi:F-type H+-transporting ATPase subunit epsilon